MRARDKLAEWIVTKSRDAIKYANTIKSQQHVFNDEVVYEIIDGVEPTEKDIDEVELMETYKTVLWVFVGVNTIASLGAKEILNVWRRLPNGDRESCHNHPVHKLFNNPNKLLSRFELFVKTYAYPELAGNCYWFLEEGFNKEPFRIHVVQPHLVRIESKPRDDGRATEDVRFIRQVPDGGIEVYEQNSVVHFTHFNPFSSFNGMPPILAGQDQLLLDLYLTNFGKNFFKNAVVPSVVFTTEKNIGDAGYERFKAMVTRDLQGYRNMHKYLVLYGGLKPEHIQVPSPADSGYLDANELTRDKIFFNLGMYHLLALANDRSGEAIERAERLFWEQTMMPRMINIQEQINKVVMPKYKDFPDCFVEYNFNAIPGLREGFDKLSSAIFKFIQSGTLGRKRSREWIGEPRELAEDDETGLTFEPALSRLMPNDLRGITEEELREQAASNE